MNLEQIKDGVYWGILDTLGDWFDVVDEQQTGIDSYLITLLESQHTEPVNLNIVVDFPSNAGEVKLALSDVNGSELGVVTGDVDKLPSLVEAISAKI